MRPRGECISMGLDGRAHIVISILKFSSLKTPIQARPTGLIKKSKAHMFGDFYKPGWVPTRRVHLTGPIQSKYFIFYFFVKVIIEYSDAKLYEKSVHH